MWLAWLTVSALFAAIALVGVLLPRTWMDWQPGLIASEPWRALTPIGVHYSASHLVGNLAGAALMALGGIAARATARMALAWLAAWPLTHLGLLLQPELRHYGGLSGVLHAGAAVLVVWVLASSTTRAQRVVGLAIALGLAAKIIGESPWGAALRYPAGWDIAVAPLVHATGAAAGVFCALAALVVARRGTRSQRASS